MRTGRVEAFSDGVLAILITIMVLELPKPGGPGWSALAHDWPVLLAYALSFLYIGIYWNNHHHMFQAVHRVSGGVLWANLHLLFWLSLVPFVTGWVSEQWVEGSELPVVPVAVYGIALLAAGTAYWILQSTLIRAEGAHSALAAAVGRFVNPWLGVATYFVVAAIWLIPDRRVERQLAHEAERTRVTDS